MPKQRLGVALLLSPPLADEVDGLRRALGDRSLARIPPHLTLVPPVNVREEQLGTALAVLRAAAAAIPGPITVSLGPPTSFLPANPVLYLPVGGDIGAVTALRDRVWAPPFVRSLTWPFVAHVTLADVTPADAAGVERIPAAEVALADFRVEATFDRVHLLVERRPGPGKEQALWVPLADAAFGRPAVIARGSPLAVELVRSRRIDPEGAALLAAEGVAEVDPSEGVVVTARREGRVVGLARAWRTPDGCRAAVLVATGHRGQGIGRFLDAALESAVAEAGWGCRYAKRMAE